MTDQYRVAVVDDHPMFRSGVIQTLRDDGRLNVVGEGCSANCAEHLAQELNLDAVVLDVRMPGGGLEAIERVLHCATPPGIVMLSVEDDAKTVDEAFRRGAQGYVLKTSGGSELVEAVVQVAKGDLYLSPQLAGRMLQRVTVRRNEPVAAQSQSFTEREEQVMQLLTDGLSNKEIAYRLDLSEKTVKFYVTRVIKKLGVQNRVQVALFASRQIGAAPVKQGGTMG